MRGLEQELIFLTLDEATGTFSCTHFSYQDNPDGKGLRAYPYSKKFFLREAEAFAENYDENWKEIRGDVLA